MSEESGTAVGSGAGLTGPGSAARWPQLAAGLAAAVLAMTDQHNERMPDGTYGTGNTVFLAVGCPDFVITTDPAAYEALAAMIAPRLGAYYAAWTLPGVFWPAPRTPAAHAPVARSVPPILVVGASLDTQDAYQWSVDMAGQLESAVLLRREGTGHPSYFHSACVTDAINAYLVDLTLPAPSLVCPSTGGLFEGIG
ncbi:MAG: hypothetical protein QOG89_3199 [Thermomicrobiales bacterium]|nr:hypothetical protein [Thermomicrobiales bacterium]